MLGPATVWECPDLRGLWPLMTISTCTAYSIISSYNSCEGVDRNDPRTGGKHINSLYILNIRNVKRDQFFHVVVHCGRWCDGVANGLKNEDHTFCFASSGDWRDLWL